MIGKAVASSIWSGIVFFRFGAIPKLLDELPASLNAKAAALQPTRSITSSNSDDGTVISWPTAFVCTEIEFIPIRSTISCQQRKRASDVSKIGCSQRATD
jgi:hypothetical protein